LHCTAEIDEGRIERRQQGAINGGSEKEEEEEEEDVIRSPDHILRERDLRRDVIFEDTLPEKRYGYRAILRLQNITRARSILIII
jgi:hypothetical protein